MSFAARFTSPNFSTNFFNGFARFESIGKMCDQFFGNGDLL